MKAPKILPWIAKKAGISDELALKLWRRAVSEAEFLVGKAEGSEYWGLAIDRFLELTEDEATSAPQSGLIPAPRLSWMWRHQGRIGLLTIVAAESTYKLWQNTWKQFYEPKKVA